MSSLRSLVSLVVCVLLLSTVALANWGKDVRASQANAFLNGKAALDYLGAAICAPGDLNGDGIADFAVGAFGDDEAATVAGKVYLVFGSAQGISGVLTPNATFLGEAEQDRAGYSLAAIGDVNGDGLADLAIGAPMAAGGQGVVYLVFGKTSGWSRGVSLARANVKIIGAQSVGGSGDVNGDGINDVVVGHTDPNSKAGAAYVFYGSANWPTTITTASANVTLTGENADDRAGSSVAIVRDMNGDGFAEVVVGAPRHTPRSGVLNAGVVYIVFGGNLPRSVSLATASVRLDGTGRRESIGSLVVAGGDVNRDGLGDLLVGSPADNNEGGGRAGSVALVLGRRYNWDRVATIDDADTTFVGEFGDDCAGASVAAAGDVNGDGIDDILVGANWFSSTQFHQGKIYLIFGRSGGWVSRVSLAAANASWLGNKGYDNLGYACGATDLDGDGLSDVIGGAYTVDIGSVPDAGQAVVFLSPYGDADGDGIPNGLESGMPGDDETNMWLADSDGDGLSDGAEDANGNRIQDPGETNPRDRDSDNDGLHDGFEVVILGSNPLDPNDPPSLALPYTDWDKDELPAAYDPNDHNPDVDGDRILDGYEAVVLGMDAVTNPNLYPGIGDVNNDGFVSNFDAFLVRLGFLDLISYNELANTSGADVTRDGVVTNLDALAIQMHFLGFQPTLPVVF